MNTAALRSSTFRITLFLSCLATGTGVGLSQQSSYPQQSQYASTSYASRQPSVKEQIQTASQNVGNFIRRRFYGESAPVSYPQQSVYQTRAYSLDAPARGVSGSGGTGFLRPTQGTTPTYVKPPIQDAAPLTTATPKPAPPTKATAPRTTRAPLPGPTTTPTKRYSPAKPSTFSKPKPTPKVAPDRVQDAPPPAADSSSTYPPAMNGPLSRDDSPPKEPVTEARLKEEVYPLPGRPGSPQGPSEETQASTSSGSSAASSSATSGSANVGGSTKSSGSFLMGKKTSKAGRVVSPFAPYNELDITGLPSGSLALDPTTQQVFEVP